jgi:hypothetical protein
MVLQFLVNLVGTMGGNTQTKNNTTTGIIYQAYNKVTQQSYIGQTLQELEVRKKTHFRLAEKYNHKFACALREYPPDSWVWTILAEVERSALNNKEIFYIDKLNTFECGYNTTKGGEYDIFGNIVRYSEVVYNLYHEEHGYLSGLRSELLKVNPAFYRLCDLLCGRRRHIHGWVLASDKKDYDKIMGIYEFFHPNYGVIKCSVSELQKSYINACSVDTVFNLIRVKIVIG